MCILPISLCRDAEEAKIVTLSIVAPLPCKVKLSQRQNTNCAIGLPVQRRFSTRTLHSAIFAPSELLFAPHEY